MRFLPALLASAAVGSADPAGRRLVGGVPWHVGGYGKSGTMTTPWEAIVFVWDEFKKFTNKPKKPWRNKPRN